MLRLEQVQEIAGHLVVSTFDSLTCLTFSLYSELGLFNFCHIQNGNKLGGRDEGDGDDEISAEEKNELLTLVSNDVTNLLNIIHARNDLIAKKFEECERNENIEYWKGNEGRELNDGSGNGEKRVLALNRWLITDGKFYI